MGLLKAFTLATYVAGAALPAAASDLLTVKARHAADRLEVGKSYEIIVELTVKDGYSASEGGIPGPLLQIDVPDCVKLSGKELKSHRELSRNEFLQEPYERLLSENPARIGFKLTSAPAADDVIALSVLAYVGAESKKEDVHFVRQRLHLAVAGGAEAEPVNHKVSTWGHEGLLQIGDKADLFTLPKANGETVALADLVGKTNIIVTTYRAHW